MEGGFGSVYLCQYFKWAHIILRGMIEEVASCTQHFATFEKDLLPLEQLSQHCGSTVYADLLMWIMENAQQLQLSMATKYHTRVYFDKVLVLSPGISQNRYMPIFIACLALAIKFHEKRQISERLTMKALMSSAGIELAVDEYFQFEVFILQTLNFKLRYTSPQEHFDSFLARFPYQKKLFQQALPSLILLALIHPQACEFTSEEIFFGAVLSVLEIVPLSLSDSQQRLLNSLTNNWEAATRVKELIEEQTRLAEEDEEDLQDE